MTIPRPTAPLRLTRFPARIASLGAAAAASLCVGLLLGPIPSASSNALDSVGEARTAEGVALPGARPVIDAAAYPSLQAALDEANAAGGLVRIPPGHFTITAPLVVSHSDVTIEGSGAATHIHNANTTGEPAVLISHADGARVKSVDRLWRVRMADFRLTGNPKSGHGIEALWVNELFVQGVTVSEHGQDGLRLDHCYEDPRVSDCLITYNKAAGLNLLGCHDIVVSANQFEENQDAVRCIDGYNLCMTGNCVDDHLRHGVVIENTYGSVLAGNMIEECHGFAVIMDRDCYGNTVSANVIAHNGGGIDLVDAHGCAISANTLTIMKTHAVRVGPSSGRITITGNNISNSYIGAGGIKRRKNDEAAAGITLSGTRDITLSGNLFSSVAPKALDMAGEKNRNILFGDNVLVDVQSDHAASTTTGTVLVVPAAPADATGESSKTPGKTP